MIKEVGSRILLGLPQRSILKLLILGLLAEKPMHGYELLKRVEEITRGFWRPSPGTLYSLLKSLREEGLVVMDHVEGSGVPSGLRIVYRLTRKGHDQLQRLAPRMVVVFESIAWFFSRFVRGKVKV